MSFYLRSTALAAIMSAGLALPAAAAETAQTQNNADQCWSEISQYDSDGDGLIGENELSENADAILAALDGDGNGEVTREEFEGCFLGQQQPRTDQRFDDLDRDSNDVIVVAEMSGETSAEGAQITVDQAQPQVRVDQAQPTVTVDQPQPQVTVDQAQPTVTVDQPQPEVQVEQAQPTVTVDQPQPEVQVEQAQPTVTVDQPKPEVQVEQAQPQVQVEQAQPQVQVEQGQPQVEVEQAKPEVQVEQGQPQVNVEQEKPEGQAEQQTPADAEKTETETVIVTPAPADGAQSPVAEREQTSFDLTRFSADELMSMEVENTQGNDLGDIEDVVVDANDEVFFVIGVGGFLGIGERSVAFPAKDFQVVEDKLVLQTSQTEDELKQLPQYDESQYEKHNW